MDDIEPNGHREDTGLVESFGGTITRRSFDFVEWAVIVIARGTALTVFGVVQTRIQVPPKPDKPFHGRVEPVQKEVSHANDQQGFPRDRENEEATGIKDNMSQTDP